MTRIFQLTLILTTFCSVQQIDAAERAVDPFAGLEPRLARGIIPLVEKPGNNIKEILAAFNRSPVDIQHADICSLFNLFGNKLFNNYCSVSKLLTVTSELNVVDDSNVRDAFFYFPTGSKSTKSMLSHALCIASYPLTELTKWFRETDSRHEYMLKFLNRYDANYIFAVNLHVSARPAYPSEEEEAFKTRLLHVCNHIGFNAWDRVRPAMRLLLQGEIDKQDTKTLQTFFAQQGKDFIEETEDVEEGRKEAFGILIKDLVNVFRVELSIAAMLDLMGSIKPGVSLKAIPDHGKIILELKNNLPGKVQADFHTKAVELITSVVEGLTGVAEVLTHNSHLFVDVSKVLESCFTEFKKLSSNFEIDPRFIAAYIASLRLYTHVFNIDDEIKNVLSVCRKLSVAEFAAACELLVDHPGYHEFLECSEPALRNYIHSNHEDSKDAGKRHHVFGAQLDALVKIDLLNNNYIRYMLGRPTLKQLLLEHCTADLEKFFIASSSNVGIDDPV